MPRRPHRDRLKHLPTLGRIPPTPSDIRGREPSIAQALEALRYTYSRQLETTAAFFKKSETIGFRLKPLDFVCTQAAVTPQHLDLLDLELPW